MKHKFIHTLLQEFFTSHPRPERTNKLFKEEHEEFLNQIYSVETPTRLDLDMVLAGCRNKVVYHIGSSETRLFDLTGITATDFVCFVYLHQEFHRLACQQNVIMEIIDVSLEGIWVNYTYEPLEFLPPIPKDTYQFPREIDEVDKSKFSPLNRYLPPGFLTSNLKIDYTVYYPAIDWETGYKGLPCIAEQDTNYSKISGIRMAYVEGLISRLQYQNDVKKNTTVIPDPVSHKSETTIVIDSLPVVNDPEELNAFVEIMSGMMADDLDKDFYDEFKRKSKIDDLDRPIKKERHSSRRRM